MLIEGNSKETLELRSCYSEQDDGHAVPMLPPLLMTLRVITSQTERRYLFLFLEVTKSTPSGRQN